MTFISVNVEPVDAVHDLQVDFWLKAIDRSDEAGGKWLLGWFVSSPWFEAQRDEEVPSYYCDKIRASVDIP